MSDRKRSPEELLAQKKAAVKVVNKLRKLAGLGRTSVISKGWACNSAVCPVAMSLPGSPFLKVHANGAQVRTKKSPAAFLPWNHEFFGLTSEEAALMTQFILDIDDGRYPELVRGPELVRDRVQTTVSKGVSGAPAQ